MPIYVYKCDDCGYEFEEFRELDSKSHPVCPDCYSENVKKQIARVNLNRSGDLVPPRS